tara:strand:- start:305 stop:451 length:147 start_codon:yes stop_codon:yes gene_type:complete
VKAELQEPQFVSAASNTILSGKLSSDLKLYEHWLVPHELLHELPAFGA